MLKFTKTHIGTYVAIKSDGTEITIEKTDYTEKNMQWKVSYHDDFNGDNTHFAATKKELIKIENRYDGFA